jgi:hypothetical protein
MNLRPVALQDDEADGLAVSKHDVHTEHAAVEGDRSFDISNT